MKANLINLGLSEDLVSKILDAFDLYEWSLKEYSKPKGKIAFQKNMEEIAQLSKKLESKLAGITRMERQFLNELCNPTVSDLLNGLTILTISCENAQKKNVRFSRRAPFLLDLTIELWTLLERHGVPVTVYKENVLCQVLNTLIPQPVSENDEDVLPEDTWAFHLLREASQRIPKS